MKKEANVVLCILIGIGVAFALTKLPGALTPKGLFVEEPKEGVGDQRPVQLERVELEQDRDKWVKAFFVVRNGAPTAIKNVEILCEFYSEDGDYRDQDKWVLYGELPAGKAMGYKTLQRKFIHTQSANIKCRVAGYTPVSPAPPDHGASDHEAHDHDADHGSHN